MLGLLSVSGVIGTWAGPRSAGTAYVMLHHHIGDIGRPGRRVGLPARRDGRGDRRAGRGGPVVRRRDPHRGRGGADPHPAGAGTRSVAGVTLASGEEIDAATVITTAHPQISFLRLLDPAVLPRGLRRRHPALADAQRHREDQPGPGPAAGLRQPSRARPADPRRHDRAGGEPGRHRDRVPAGGQRASRRPRRSPTSASRACSTTRSRRPGSTSCRCSPSGCRTAARPRRTRPSSTPTPTGCIARMEQVAPGFTSSVLHRQVIGPHQMQQEYGLVGGNIFHGELSLGQMFHARPAAGYADLRTPVRRAVPGGLGHPRRRRGDRHPGPQRGAPGPRRPADRPAAPAGGRADRRGARRPPPPQRRLAEP